MPNFIIHNKQTVSSLALYLSGRIKLCQHILNKGWVSEQLCDTDKQFFIGKKQNKKTTTESNITNQTTCRQKQKEVEEPEVYQSIKQILVVCLESAVICRFFLKEQGGKKRFTMLFPLRTIKILKLMTGIFSVPS